MELFAIWDILDMAAARKKKDCIPVVHPYQPGIELRPVSPLQTSFQSPLPPPPPQPWPEAPLSCDVYKLLSRF